MITPPRRTGLGTFFRAWPSSVRGSGSFCLAEAVAIGCGRLGIVGILALSAAGTLACGDPNDPLPTTGSLSGTVRNADTDAQIEGVTLVVAGIEGQTGSDGRYQIDSIPAGTQVVALSASDYVGRFVEAEVRPGAVTTLSIELDPTSSPGPTPLAIVTSELPQATVDAPYEASLEAEGGAPPYAWTWGSQGPPGLLLDATGVVTGTPGFPAGTHPSASRSVTRRV